MRSSRASPLIPLVVTFIVLIACNYPVSTPRIENAVMARDYEGNFPTSVFNQQDTFYNLAELIDSPNESTVKAIWIAVNTDGIEPNLIIDETEIITRNGVIHFELNNETLWPRGFYRLDLFLNGELAQILEFEVQ